MQKSKEIFVGATRMAIRPPFVTIEVLQRIRIKNMEILHLSTESSFDPEDYNDFF